MFYKYFEKDAIADGATYSDEWTAEEEYIIKRVHVANKDGSSFTDSTLYLKISELVYTRPVVPAVNLGPDVLTSPELNIKFTKGAKLEFTFKNLEGKTVSVMITFETWKP